jgi:hypothetical protein
MNRFAKLIGALKQRPVNDQFKKSLESLDKVDVIERDDDSAHEFYLPYSSEPKSLDERWR